MKKTIIGHCGRGIQVVDIVLIKKIAEVSKFSQRDIDMVKECITESIMPLESLEFNKDKKSKKGKYKKNWE